MKSLEVEGRHVSRSSAMALFHRNITFKTSLLFILSHNKSYTTHRRTAQGSSDTRQPIETAHFSRGKTIYKTFRISSLLLVCNENERANRAANNVNTKRFRFCTVITKIYETGKQHSHQFIALPRRQQLITSRNDYQWHRPRKWGGEGGRGELGRIISIN